MHTGGCRELLGHLVGVRARGRLEALASAQRYQRGRPRRQWHPVSFWGSPFFEGVVLLAGYFPIPPSRPPFFFGAVVAGICLIGF